ncbi:MAG TPA: rhomboid family intramembrane serine protease [Cyclobacteriaceae bacterium]|nr:rhomboid family intramembrane serine protease [Cyclobacteriaceae bacterium]
MFGEFRNAFDRYNNGHVQLIIINVVIFIVMIILFATSRWFGFEAAFEVVEKIFVLPPKFGDFLMRAWTLITYSFAHDWTTIWHIVFNMLALYWFGQLFIEYLGNDKLIAVYVLGGLAGGILYLLMFNVIPFFEARSEFSGLVGASAAVFAVMMAIVTLIPDYTFMVLLLGPVKIKYIALFYIVLSFIGSVGVNAGGEISHLGGLLIGFVYTRQLQAGVNWGSWVTATLTWINGLFKASPKVKVTYRKNEPATAQSAKKGAPKPGFNKATQEEIDAILDKISDKGYESLTKEEKEKLFNASKK